MSPLIECLDCHVGFTDEVLRAHLGQGHKLWMCKVCPDLVRRVIAWGPTVRLAVCSWTCFGKALELGHCRHCLKPPAPDFLGGHCINCRLALTAKAKGPPATFDEADFQVEPEPAERAAWLPAKYRRSGWSLGHSPYDDEEDAA